jgi:hypothetical protein
MELLNKELMSSIKRCLLLELIKWTGMISTKVTMIGHQLQMQEIFGRKLKQ